MDKITITAEKAEYLYVIKRIIPENMPIVACRRAGRQELAGRKLIKCPYCRELLIHIDRHTLVKIYSLPKGKKKEIPGLIIRRCDYCKEEVGMLMVI